MGSYINPTDRSKEKWLDMVCEGEKGTEISLQELNAMNFHEAKIHNHMVVVWLDNGFFTALLCCNTEGEMNYMKEALPSESRPYRIYAVDWSLAEKEIR